MTARFCLSRRRGASRRAPRWARSALMAGLLFGLAGSVCAVECRDTDLGFGAHGAHWSAQSFSSLKRSTQYSMIKEGEDTVLRAVSDRSASLYVTRPDAAAANPATLSWRWKTDALVPGADNRDKRREDAPLRVVVAFDGDPATLPDDERKRYARAKSLTGAAPPYAVLMYIWGNSGLAADALITSAHTSRLKMIAVDSGKQGLGQWQSVKRDVRADYRAAFGSEPGPMTGIGVMTDTDNTGSKAVGLYSALKLGC